MKTLVISKPIYEYIIPLVEFPQDGDHFFIKDSTKTVSSIGSIIATTLRSYGIDTSFTGIVGEDDLGNKIKDHFNSYNVDTTYIETNYEEHTSINYKIYNSKSNKFTTITEDSMKKGLMKYKYEFIPDVIIMDDGDYNANMAAINNYPNANLIYISEKYTKDSSGYLNKCNYVIATLKFASEATGVLNNLNKPKTLVTLFQKYIDLYSSNLIIILDNFDILYCINDEVRLIKNVNKNIVNKDYVYYALLVYFIINTNNIEISIKYANKAMQDSKSELDMSKNIPEYNIVGKMLEEIKLKEETPKNNNVVNEPLNNNEKIENQTNNNIVSNNQNVTNNIVQGNNEIKQNTTVNETVKEQNVEMPIENNEIKGDNEIERL